MAEEVPGVLPEEVQPGAEAVAPPVPDGMVPVAPVQARQRWPDSLPAQGSQLAGW